MDKAAYLQTQTQILAFAQVVRDMPLDEFMLAISRAHSLGPIVDPTLYRDGVANMTKIEDLARGLLEFQRVVRRITTEERHDEAG